MAILTGLYRIAKDCEIRYLPNGEPVINLLLVYNYGNKKNADGYLPSQFIEAGLWGKRAELLQEYLTKRTKLFCSIEDVHIETYQKQDQSTGFKLTGRIGALEFADSAPQQDEGGFESQGTRGMRSNTAQAPATPQRQAPAPRPAPAPRAAAGGGGVMDMDDDIPFNQLPARYDI